jgi:activator of HSP90 ATPase
MAAEKTMRSIELTTMTRRRAVMAAAMALGGTVVSARASGEAGGQMAQMPAEPSSSRRTSLHQEWQIPATPARVYAVLLDAKQFAKLTALPAEIDPRAGGAFSLFQGQIQGRNVELVRDLRLVQAWRPSHWDAGVYSIVRFVLKAQGAGTLVVLDHTGFPEGDFDHLGAGWHGHYEQALMRFFK